MTLGFTRLELRTTAVSAAKTFYEALLGRGTSSIVALSPQAAAHGAPAHWVGFVGVDDMERVTHHLLQCGASIIGPSSSSKSGFQDVTLKGPGGAVIGVTANRAQPDANEVGFFQLLVPDAAQVVHDYCKIFDWKVVSSARSQTGFTFHLIGGNKSQVATGMVVDNKDFPGSHPHWLYYFRVSKLAPAASQVRHLGGDVVGIYPSPLGHDIAVCHDPQGAAFGLVAAV